MNYHDNLRCTHFVLTPELPYPWYLCSRSDGYARIRIAPALPPLLHSWESRLGCINPAPPPDPPLLTSTHVSPFLGYPAHLGSRRSSRPSSRSSGECRGRGNPSRPIPPGSPVVPPQLASTRFHIHPFLPIYHLPDPHTPAFHYSDRWNVGPPSNR